ncbi:isoprenyl transferase [Petroclostridium sp. X23]|uniref:isoprenyl transferase n=1 Tax=Petroclostridium sp. X23 TaxID=3045146 RepID=UPI0024ADCF5E|nr:isoprenyl transferase [Petroclostridium sp. X23]WHH61787.1 isoprenyl transferase [Petroclostridium sp. X23]
MGINKSKEKIDASGLPEHIAIIMDGNGRWAQKRGLPRSAGHRAGAQTIRKITEFSNEIGIKVLTVYAFSTENWKRPEGEVNFLMDLLLEFLKDAERQLAGKNIVIKVIGDIKLLSEEIQQQIHKTETLTQNNSGLLLNIAINYGGRDEIINAVKRIVSDVQYSGLNIEEVDEYLMSRYMYTKGLKDPDLIIRPSGELRLSNFLLWQSAYSELWFSNINWPDFTTENLLEAIRDYQQRHRRYGGI